MRIVLVDPCLAYGPLDAHFSPLGGTETSWIALAESFQAWGHEVHVYLRQPGVPEYEGVSYHKLGDHAGATGEVVIARSPDLFQDRGASKKGRIWWCHRSLETESVLLAQKFQVYPVVTSRFQADQLSTCGWRGGFDVIPLGCRLLRFRPGRHAREPFTAIWTSAFDRGLAQLLAIWRAIRDRLPRERKLLIAGGGEVYRERGHYLHTCEANLRRETEGEADIAWLGPLPPQELFSVLSSSGFLPYTATVPESFCLAVLEAQAAGCLPIVAPKGALKERVHHGKTGWIEPLESFGERIVTYCGHAADPEIGSMRKAAEEAAARLSWEEVAKRFEEAIRNCLATIL